MSTISVPYTFSSGAVIVASEHNSNFTTIYNDYNGSITNANLSASAAIADTKLATISTAGKVNISALTVTSQAQGDVLYASNAATWARLAKGTADQVLNMNAGATAPEWSSVASILPDGAVLQVVNTTDATFTDITTAMPVDNTIPQKTEGDEVFTRAITPSATTNKLRIDVVVNAGVDNDSRSNVGVGLFQDATAGALACAFQTVTKGNAGSSNVIGTITLTHYMDAGTVAETTFKVRVGMESGQSDVSVNGVNGAVLGGGVLASSITITEIKAS